MENSVINKKTEISDLLKEYKELIILYSEYIKNKYYFFSLEETLNDEEENDIQDLRKEHFNLGVDFREFVNKYNIDHCLIKESIINTFLKEKLPTYILKGEEPVINDNLKEQQQSTN